MKRFLLIVLPLLLIIGCSKPISEETLIDKDGLKYHPETKELYSGKVFKNYMGGGKEFEGSYKDGKKDGLWTTWFENGKKEFEKNYKDGKKDLMTYWDKNDGKMYKGKFIGSDFFVSSSLNGSYWGTKPEKSFNFFYHFKIPFYFSDTFYHGTFKDGKLDGSLTSWYEHGQKELLCTWKDGKPDGFATSWYKHGQKKEEVSFKDGEWVSQISWYKDGVVIDSWKKR